MDPSPRFETLPIFLSVPGQIVFYAASYFILFAASIVGSARRKEKPLKADRSKAQRASTRYSGLLLIFGPLVAAGFGYSGTALIPDWGYYVGLSFSILSAAIWFWGQQTLGQYYSHEAVVYQGHQLVERGPYKFVRHPIYAAGLLLCPGIGLMSQSWIAVAVITIVATIILAYRIQVEEKTLVSEFGEQYVAYSRRVKKLIPFIY